MEDELKPTLKEDNNLDLSLELNNKVIEEEKEEISNFVKGFPDWDLLPPNQVVRRVTRK